MPFAPGAPLRPYSSDFARARERPIHPSRPPAARCFADASPSAWAAFTTASSLERSTTERVIVTPTSESSPVSGDLNEAWKWSAIRAPSASASMSGVFSSASSTGV